MFKQCKWLRSPADRPFTYATPTTTPEPEPPLQVGDWVRLDCGGGHWVDGPVVTLLDDFGHAAIDPLRSSPALRIRCDGTPFSFRLEDNSGRLRIPRPASAPTSELVGDGMADDTEALKELLKRGGGVLPNGTGIIGTKNGIRLVRPTEPPPDQVIIDDISLQVLLECDEIARRESESNWRNGSQRTWTPAQRAAVSAHHSAQLRAKVAASDAERKASATTVRVQIEVDEW
jgi:hypothetical protein